MFPQMADIVKPGKVGSAEVEIFEISKAEAEVTAFRAMVTGRLEEFCPPGRYARLYVSGQIMMSDTMMEHRSNEILIEEAKGRVLVGGLGLGMLVHGLVKVAGVESIDVVEINQDVIDLVRSTLPSSVNIINADVFNWEPVHKYDHMIFDIWPTICRDNLEEMKLLRVRYKRWGNPGCKIVQWMENYFADKKTGRD